MAYQIAPYRNMESVIIDLEACYDLEKSHARIMSDRAKELHGIIFKMKQEKSSIARNSCPECNKQKDIFTTWMHDKLLNSKRKASGSDSDLHKVAETLKCENEKLLSDLESYKRESKIKIEQLLKEKERLLEDLDNRTEGYKELLDMTGARKREFNDSILSHEESNKILKDEIMVKDLEIQSLKKNIREQETRFDQLLQNNETQKDCIKHLNDDNDNKIMCDKRLREATEQLEQQKVIINALESDKEQLKELYEEAVRQKDEYLQKNLTNERINDETIKENKDLHKKIDLQMQKWNEIAAKLKTNQAQFDQDITEKNTKYYQQVEKGAKMKDELDNLRTELKECKNIKAEFEKKFNDSEKVIFEHLNQNENLTQKLKSKTQKLNNAMKEKDILETEKCEEIQKLKRTLEAIEEDVEEKKKVIDEFQENNAYLQETLKQVTEKEQECKSKIVELEERQKELQTTQLELELAKNSAKNKMAMYKEISSEWKTKYDDLLKQYIDIKQELQKELTNVKYFSEQEKRSKSEAEEKEKQIQDLQTIIHHLISDLEKSKAECKELQNELEKLTFKPRKLIELGVFSSMKQKLTDIVLSDLDRQLKGRLDIENTDLHLHPTVAQSDLKRPSIVLCISISSLGADVQEALKGITASSQVAIIIFHHKEAHALPSQSSEKILTGPDYKQLGAIIDMAILSNKGIYNCVMNEAGLEKLLAFVRRF